MRFCFNYLSGILYKFCGFDFYDLIYIDLSETMELWNILSDVDRSNLPCGELNLLIWHKLLAICSSMGLDNDVLPVYSWQPKRPASFRTTLLHTTVNERWRLNNRGKNTTHVSRQLTNHKFLLCSFWQNICKYVSN